MSRAQRFNEFTQRAASQDVSVHHTIQEIRYISIHPFADEHELLERIGWRSDLCLAVDAWVCMSEDMVLVQVYCLGHMEHDEVGLWAVRASLAPHVMTLSAVIDDKVVTRRAFEAMLTEIWREGFPGLESGPDELPVRTVRIF